MPDFAEKLVDNMYSYSHNLSEIFPPDTLFLPNWNTLTNISIPPFETAHSLMLWSWPLSRLHNSLWTNLSFCFGGLITLFHCSIPRARFASYHHIRENSKRVLFIHTSYMYLCLYYFGSFPCATFAYGLAYDGCHTWVSQYWFLTIVLRWHFLPRPSVFWIRL